MQAHNFNGPRILSDPGFVYVMAMQDGHRKIGVSSRPLKRLVNVQNGTPQRVHLEGMWSHKAPFAVEKEIHRLLKSCRVLGEWFFVEQSAAFEAIMMALRTIPGGMLDYDDQPFLFAEHDRPGRGAVKKLVGPVLDVAKAAWADRSLTSKQVAQKILDETGKQVSVRTLFSVLGKKPQAPIVPAKEGAQPKLVGEVLNIARQAWADPNLTANQAAAKVREYTRVKVSTRTLWNHLGKKSEAEGSISEPIKVAPLPQPQPKRRKAKRKAKVTS